MAQSELPFKSMSDKELVQEAMRADAAEKQTRKRKRTTKKGSSEKSGSKKSGRKNAAKRSTKRTAKKAPCAPSKAKRFYTVQVPMGAKVSITPPCKTPKVTKGTPTPKKSKTRRSKRAE